MAHAGYLIKVGDYTIPTDKFIRAGSYSPYVNMQAVDPYTDANGYEHIDAVELKALKVEFETPEGMSDTEFQILMSGIRENYIEAKSRKCMVTAYITELGTYVTQLAYLVDLKPVVYREDDNELYYHSTRFAFVGGVAND